MRCSKDRQPGREGVGARARGPGPAIALVGAITLGAITESVRAQVVYDGSQLGTVNSQPWFVFAGTGQQTNIGGGTLLTTQVADRCGYASHYYNPFGGGGVVPRNAQWPALNRGTGFTLRFDVAVQSETHTSANRAGFSVLAVASDHRAVEIAFWPAEVWVQAESPLFMHAEGAAVATGPSRRYDLVVQGDGYTLYAAGQVVLAGALRDYSAFDAGAAGLVFSPYTTANFVFLGDNTSQAGGAVVISRIELKAGAAAPPCAADFDGSGGVDSGDFLSWLLAFAGGEESADTSLDGALDSADFLGFVLQLAGGC